MLGVLPRRAGLNDLPAHAGLEAHPLAFDVGAGLAKIAENLRIVMKLHAGIAQYPIGILPRSGTGPPR